MVDKAEMYARYLLKKLRDCPDCDGGTFKEYDIDSKYGEPVEIICGTCQGTRVKELSTEELLLRGIISTGLGWGLEKFPTN